MSFFLRQVKIIYLVFFVDIDIILTEKTLLSGATLTVPGQVYFPIFFSIFAPKCRVQQRVSENNGFWRIYSTGMVFIFKADYERTAGFDLSIDSWGQEDLRFTEAVISAKLKVIRAKDQDLIHPWHPKNCKNLFKESFQECVPVKMAHYCSYGMLYEEWKYQQSPLFQEEKLKKKHSKIALSAK